MKTTQKIQKNTKCPPPQKKSELGLDPPTRFRVFLGFFYYFFIIFLLLFFIICVLIANEHCYVSIFLKL